MKRFGVLVITALAVLAAILFIAPTVTANLSGAAAAKVAVKPANDVPHQYSLVLELDKAKVAMVKFECKTKVEGKDVVNKATALLDQAVEIGQENLQETITIYEPDNSPDVARGVTITHYSPDDSKYVIYLAGKKGEKVKISVNQSDKVVDTVKLVLDKKGQLAVNAKLDVVKSTLTLSVGGKTIKTIKVIEEGK